MDASMSESLQDKGSFHTSNLSSRQDISNMSNLEYDDEFGLDELNDTVLSDVDEELVQPIVLFPSQDRPKDSSTDLLLPPLPEASFIDDEEKPEVKRPWNSDPRRLYCLVGDITLCQETPDKSLGPKAKSPSFKIPMSTPGSVKRLRTVSPGLISPKRQHLDFSLFDEDQLNHDNVQEGEGEGVCLQDELQALGFSKFNSLNNCSLDSNIVEVTATEQKSINDDPPDETAVEAINVLDVTKSFKEDSVEDPPLSPEIPITMLFQENLSINPIHSLNTKCESLLSLNEAELSQVSELHESDMDMSDFDENQPSTPLKSGNVDSPLTPKSRCIEQLRTQNSLLEQVSDTILQTVKEDLERTIEALNNDSLNISQENHQLQLLLHSKSENIQNLQFKIEELEQKVVSSTQEITTLKSHCSEKDKQLTDLYSEFELKQIQLQNIEKQNTELQFKLEQSSVQLDQLLSLQQSLEISQQKNTELELNLKQSVQQCQALNNQLIALQEQAKSTQQLESTNASLKSRLIEMEDKVRDVIIELDIHRQETEHAKALNQELLEFRDQLLEKEERVRDLIIENKELEGKLSRAEDALDDKKLEIEEIEERERLSLTEIDGLKDQIQNLQLQISNLELNLSQAQSLSQAQEQSILKYQSELGPLQEKITKYKFLELDFEVAKSKQCKSLQDHRLLSQIQSVFSTQTQLELSLDTLTSTLQQLKSTQSQLTDSKSTRSQLESKLKAELSRADGLSHQLNKIKHELSKTTFKLECEKNQVSRLTEDLKGSQLQLQESSERVTQQEQVNESLLALIQDKDTRIRILTKDHEEVKAQLEEALRLSAQTPSHPPADSAQIEKLQAQIQDLKMDLAGKTSELIQLGLAHSSETDNHRQKVEQYKNKIRELNNEIIRAGSQKDCFKCRPLYKKTVSVQTDSTPPAKEVVLSLASGLSPIEAQELKMKMRLLEEENQALKILYEKQSRRLKALKEANQTTLTPEKSKIQNSTINRGALDDVTNKENP